jgi:hypothetical protein
MQPIRKPEPIREDEMYDGPAPTPLAVRARLEGQLVAALAAYGARHGALPEAAYRALTNLPRHLWPTPKISLDAANAFIRNHGEWRGIAPFDDDAKAILLAAHGQGGGFQHDGIISTSSKDARQIGLLSAFSRANQWAGGQRLTR